VLVSGSTFRYFFGFTGSMPAASGISFVAGSWASTTGQAATAGAATAATPVQAVWFDVTYSGVGGLTLATLLTRTLSLSGAGASSLVAAGAIAVDGDTVRYFYTGSLVAGAVDVGLAAGWTDAAGNAGSAAAGHFTLIEQGKSFFIELSGGILLQALGLMDEPLLDLHAQVTLEIDVARKVFILTFSGAMSIYGLGTVGATAGRFILDLGDPSTSVPQFWGVATVNTDFSALEPYGLSLYGAGTLQINLTGQTRTETLTLEGLGANGGPLTKTYTLNPYSFGLELAAKLEVKIPTTSTVLFRVQGGVYLSVSMSEHPQMDLYLTGEFTYGTGAYAITYGSVTGVLFVRTDPGHILSLIHI
jgi:hypothetical protein